MSYCVCHCSAMVLVCLHVLIIVSRFLFFCLWGLVFVLLRCSLSFSLCLSLFRWRVLSLFLEIYDMGEARTSC